MRSGYEQTEGTELQEWQLEFVCAKKLMDICMRWNDLERFEYWNEYAAHCQNMIRLEYEREEERDKVFRITDEN